MNNWRPPQIIEYQKVQDIIQDIKDNPMKLEKLIYLTHIRGIVYGMECAICNDIDKVKKTIKFIRDLYF